MFRYIRRTNHVLLLLNLIFLRAIALQLFSTELVAENYDKPEERTATLVYYSILFSTSLSYNAVWCKAVQIGLVSGFCVVVCLLSCCSRTAATRKCCNREVFN